MPTKKSTTTPKPVKLTALRMDILQLCATEDDHGNKGIPQAIWGRFKPSSKRTVTFLQNQHLIELVGTFHNHFFVVTAYGQSVYEAWINEEDGEPPRKAKSGPAKSWACYYHPATSRYSITLDATAREAGLK